MGGLRQMERTIKEDDWMFCLLTQAVLIQDLRKERVTYMEVCTAESLIEPSKIKAKACNAP